VTITLQR